MATLQYCPALLTECRRAIREMFGRGSMTAQAFEVVFNRLDELEGRARVVPEPTSEQGLATFFELMAKGGKK